MLDALWQNTWRFERGWLLASLGQFVALTVLLAVAVVVGGWVPAGLMAAAASAWIYWEHRRR